MTKQVCEPWVTETELVDCGCPTAALPAAQLAEVILAATQALFMLSGEQWPGECEETVRPCRCGNCSGSYLIWYGPRGLTTACGCGDSYCGCQRGQAIVLPRTPVASVDTVIVDGVTLDAADYRLDLPNKLVRLDGESWPCCQDQTLDTTEVGTWQVAYTWGSLPPPGGKAAALTYTNEMVKACAGDSSCRLPRGTTQITRRGVTISTAPGAGASRTGLAEVDAWLDTVNPLRRRRPKVMAADDPAFARPA